MEDLRTLGWLLEAIGRQQITISEATRLIEGKDIEESVVFSVERNKDIKEMNSSLKYPKGEIRVARKISKNQALSNEEELLTGKVFKIFDYTKPSQEIIEIMNASSFRAATFPELVSFIKKQPKYLTQFKLIALGSTIQERSGIKILLGVCYGEVNIFTFDFSWAREHRFLGILK